MSTPMTANSTSVTAEPDHEDRQMCSGNMIATAGNDGCLQSAASGMNWLSGQILANSQSVQLGMARLSTLEDKIQLLMDQVDKVFT